MGLLPDIDHHPVVNCIHCDTSIYVPEDFAREYFWRKPSRCPKCSKTLDWWGIILRCVRDTPPNLSDPLAAIGIRFRRHEIMLYPGRYTELRPLEIVPSGATVLNVTYGEISSGLRPIEVHGNIPQRYK